ncbi:MAG: hypothetical protein U9Q70_12895 [Chloroflexota bacterium]|nr:hypothetical protein [Chloroflexota bacterium]
MVAVGAAELSPEAHAIGFGVLRVGEDFVEEGAAPLLHPRFDLSGAGGIGAGGPAGPLLNVPAQLGAIGVGERSGEVERPGVNVEVGASQAKAGRGVIAIGGKGEANRQWFGSVCGHTKPPGIFRVWYNRGRCIRFPLPAGAASPAWSVPSLLHTTSWTYLLIGLLTI